MENKKIILASSSPRRIEMMKKHGITPTIMPANVDETLPENIAMRDAVMFLALKKALFVENQSIAENIGEEGTIVIAADTVVYKDEIMGKPNNRQEAFEMLTKLKNTSHYVATGVAIIKTGEYYKKVFCEVTEVFVKDFTDDELNAYLDTDEPYDKAGAYAIQGLFSKYIDHIQGDFNTVVGFPWDRIVEELSVL